MTLKEGKTSLIAGAKLPSPSTYTFLTPGSTAFQEVHTATSILNVSSSNNTIPLQTIVISGSAGKIRNNQNVTYVTVEVID